jgi:DNA gyrase subunit A
MSENIIRRELSESMAQSYLDYAMSVIVSRALPDVRDGLKPVHRRIIYAMNDLGMAPNKAYKKSARVVGDVLGKYHPHGDSSVYEAMVKLAQDFSTRYPLVDGHGNFGSVDGDSAAAMRYTEARLSYPGYQMLQDIAKNTVDFKNNFDESLQEPTVLPTLVPCLLLNGSTGIAVGMATNIAPHNSTEVFDAIDFIIDKTMIGEQVNIDDLIQIIKAPDFPTGGIIAGLSGVIQAFKTGRGRIVINSKYEIEEIKKRQAIIISEIPYRVNKARVIEKIAELMRDKRIDTIHAVRDESDQSGMRIVIELKKDTNPQYTINNLFKYTQLQESFSVNNIALVNGEPKLLNLKEMLDHFLSHAAGVILRRTEYEINKAREREHAVEGILIALNNIETVIDLIQNSNSLEDTVNSLVEMGLSEIQAKIVVDMRLRSLAKAPKEKFELELDQLKNDITKYSNIIEDQSVLLQTMKVEFAALKAQFGDKRRTNIEMEAEDFDEESLVKDETLIVTITNDGSIKSVEENAYKTQGRGVKGVKSTDIKDDEIIKELITVNSKSDILFFTDQGRCHVLKAYKISKSNRATKGRSLANYLNLNPGEIVKSILSADLKDNEKDLLIATRKGIIKRLSLEQLSTRMSTTKVISFKDEDSLVSAVIVSADSNVILTTSSGLAARISMDASGSGAVRPMGRQAAGVKGVTFKTKKDYVVDMILVKPDTTVFTISENGLGKRTPIDQYPTHNRGGKGVVSQKITGKTGPVVAAITVTDEYELFVVTEQGLVARLDAAKISTMGRNTSGVKIMNLNEGDKIVSISKISKAEEE